MRCSSSFQISFFVTLLTTLLFLDPIRAFSFNTSTPTQCGPLTVAWDGGKGPYHLILVPTEQIPDGRIWNISIPTDLTGAGSYTFDLVEPAGQEFLATMYDATGFGSGGTTPVLTVGSSSNSSCLTSDLNYDFYFSISPQTNPGQCSNMEISWPDNVTYPLQLLGLIPDGSAFNIPVPQSASSPSTTWKVDIAQGTEFLLLMADSGEYQTGGSSVLLSVGGGSSSCLNSTSPSTATSSASSSQSQSSTSSAASQSVSGVGGGSAGGSSISNGNGKHSNKTNIGAIVGGVIGGIAALVLLGLLLWWLCCRRKGSRKSQTDNDSMKNYGVVEKPRRPLDILGGAYGRRHSEEGLRPHSRGVELNDEEYEPSPFRYPSPVNERTAPPMAAAVAAAATEGSSPSSPARLSHPPSLVPGAAAPYEKDRMGSATTRNRYSSHTTTTQTRQSSEVPFDGPNGFDMGGSRGYTASQIQSPTTWNTGSNPVSPAIGAGAAVSRVSSVRKTPSSNALRRTSGLPDEVDGQQRDQEEEGVVERETRFVQHEDAGQVVDLPPRYDQLRASNPDPQ